jgi:AcrR family transcriptional regulator
MLGSVPKLWNETIESHRHAVRDAILDATWKLVDEHGSMSVTMTQVAAEVGIGRATLYKYFPDIESILRAHHQQDVQQHLGELTELAAGAGSVDERLEALLLHYARICQYRSRHSSTDLSALLHGAPEVVDAEARLRKVFVQVLAEAAIDGAVRADVAASELADFCLHALTAAANAPGETALRRVVKLVRTAIVPPRTTSRP